MSASLEIRALVKGPGNLTGFAQVRGSANGGGGDAALIFSFEVSSVAIAVSSSVDAVCDISYCFHPQIYPSSLRPA